MNSDIETKLDRALSGTAFSVQEKEQMLTQLFDSIEPVAAAEVRPRLQRAWHKMWVWMGVPALGAAAAIAFFWFAPANTVSVGEMAARGDGADSAVAIPLSLRCAGHVASQCALGQEVQLGIGPLATTAYAAVVAVDANDILTWFYPDASGNSLSLSPGKLHSVALNFDTESQPGAYRVFVLVYPEPPSRALVRARFSEQATTLQASTSLGLIQLLLGSAPQVQQTADDSGALANED